MGDYKSNAFINEAVKSLFIESHVLASVGKAEKPCKLKGNIYVMRTVITLSTLQKSLLGP